MREAGRGVNQDAINPRVNVASPVLLPILAALVASCHRRLAAPEHSIDTPGRAIDGRLHARIFF